MGKWVNGWQTEDRWLGRWINGWTRNQCVDKCLMDRWVGGKIAEEMKDSIIAR